MVQKTSWAMLAVLIATSGCFHVDRFDSQQRARVQVGEMGNALQMLKYDVGRYPTASEGLQPLVINTGTWKSWHGPYVRDAELPVDPWHRPYVYSCCDTNGEFDVLTYGRDGEPGWAGRGCRYQQQLFPETQRGVAGLYYRSRHQKS